MSAKRSRKKRSSPSIIRRSHQIDLPATQSSRIAPVLLFVVLLASTIVLVAGIGRGFLLNERDSLYVADVLFPERITTLISPQLAPDFRPAAMVAQGAATYLLGTSRFPQALLLVVLHLLNIALVYLIAARFVRKTVAVAAAAVFALHPLVAANVLWITSLPAVLGATFVLTALLFALRSFIAVDWGNIAVTAIFAALAGLTHETGWATPLLVIAAAALFGPGSMWLHIRERWRTIAPVTVAEALVLVVIGAQTGRIFPQTPGATSHPFIASMLLLPQALFVPLRDSLPSGATDAVRGILTAFLVISLVVFALFRSDRRPWLGLLFALFAAIPLVNLLPFEPSMKSGGRFYLPIVGLALFFAGLIDKSMDEKGFFRRTLPIFVTIAFATAMTVLLVFETTAYRKASQISDQQIKALKTTLGDLTAWTALCENFTKQYNGVYLFENDIAPTPATRFRIVDDRYLLRQVGEKTLLTLHDPSQIDLLKTIRTIDWPDFRYLHWNGTGIDDQTNAYRALINPSMLSDEKTLEEIKLPILDSGKQTVESGATMLGIEPPDFLRGVEVAALRLTMRLAPDLPGSTAYYALGWTSDSNSYEMILPAVTGSPTTVLVPVGLDPRWLATTKITDLAITPLYSKGTAELIEAKAVYRTTLVESEAEYELPPELLEELKKSIKQMGGE